MKNDKCPSCDVPYIEHDGLIRTCAKLQKFLTNSSKMDKKYSFFFHYNKPLSKKLGRNKLSLHSEGVCYIIDGIKCNVPIYSKDNKRQPYCVMKGLAKEIVIGPNNIATIS